MTHRNGVMAAFAFWEMLMGNGADQSVCCSTSGEAENRPKADGSDYHASTGLGIASIMNRSYQDQLVENIMIEAQRWNVKCQNPTDGSGDVIVDLPADLLVSMGLSIGDELTIEVVDGAIVLTPKSKDQTIP